MKKQSKKLPIGLLALLLLLGALGNIPITAHAEESVEVTEQMESKFIYEVELFENEVQGDLSVSVMYKGAAPEVTFISPSGKEYSEYVSTEEEFRYVHSTDSGWSSFKIINAEAGMWRVRCEKADKEDIVFRPVQTEVGIAIQEFTLKSLNGKEATVYFDVTKGEVEMPYRYTISMVSADGKVIKAGLAAGEGMTGTPQELLIYMNASSCENAKLVLRVECDDDASTFDVKESEGFAYDNPDTPAALADVAVTLNKNDLMCILDWSLYQPSEEGAIAYNVKVIADGDEEHPVYNEEGTVNTNVSFFYPEDTKELEAVIAYSLDGILSREYVVSIALFSGDYLCIEAEDVVTDVMLPLKFSSKESVQLTVTLNGKTGVYRIKGQDTILFSLKEGKNEFYATFTGTDGVTHVVEKDIYFSIVAPHITLFEELDRKVFYTTMAKVSGKVENAVTLTVNGTDMNLSEDGTFLFDVPLKIGENEVVLCALSKAGVGSTMVLTLIRGVDEVISDGQDSTPKDGAEGSGAGAIASTQQKKKVRTDWKQILMYTVAGVSLGALLVVFFVAFGKKGDKKRFTGKVFVVIPILLFVASGVATGMMLYMHHRLHEFNNSLEYIEMAKQSFEKAANYLTYEADAKKLATTWGYISIGLAFLVLIAILVRRKVVYGAFWGKKAGLDEATKENDQGATEDMTEESPFKEE